MSYILANLTRQHENQIIPRTLFTKNSSPYLEAIAESGCDAIGIDWTIDIQSARARVGHKVALQGNMDPALLYASEARIQAEAGNILRNYGSGPGHVFNLGHGIFPDISPTKVATLVDTVHKQSVTYHDHYEFI